MATFPSYACILFDGYSEAPDYGVLRSQMDDGLAKQRARRTLPIITREVRIIVPDTPEKLLFDAWVKTDLFGGVGWFDFTDPADDVNKRARIVAGRYSWTKPGRVWVAACQLETLG